MSEEDKPISKEDVAPFTMAIMHWLEFDIDSPSQTIVGVTNDEWTMLKVRLYYATHDVEQPRKGLND